MPIPRSRLATLSVAFAATAAVLTGFKGVHLAPEPKNPLAGTYLGHFDFPGASRGDVTLNVGRDGSVTGATYAAEDTQHTRGISIEGRISEDGTYRGDRAGATLLGTLRRGPDGLTGTLTIVHPAHGREEAITCSVELSSNGQG